MLTLKSERRVGDHYKLEFSFQAATHTAKLRAKGEPSFENGVYPRLAIEQLADWAVDNVEKVDRLQTALR